ncbi:MAG: universal stress protein [Panacagrimonas sp.]
MKLPQSIVAVVSQQMQQSAASRRSIELARRSKARLFLCMPAYDPNIDATAEMVDASVSRRARQDYLEERMQWLGAWAAELVRQGIDANCEVFWARSADDAVLSTVLEQAPDLVIADLDRESFFKRWSVVRPATLRLARWCPAPLMLVQESSTILPAKICAALDPAHAHAPTAGLDERVLDATWSVAMAADASMELVHVFAYASSQQSSNGRLHNQIEEMRADDESKLQALADRYSVPEDRLFLRDGPVVKALYQHVVEHEVDLIALGSEYRNRIDRLLLGSTTESFLTQAPCDLLIVRPRGFEALLAKHKGLGAGSTQAARAA